MTRFAKIGLISFVLACVLLPLVIIIVQFVRLAWQMRTPVNRAIGVGAIASGFSAVEVIAIFVPLFAASYLFSRWMLERK